MRRIGNTSCRPQRQLRLDRTARLVELALELMRSLGELFRGMHLVGFREGGVDMGELAEAVGFVHGSRQYAFAMKIAVRNDVIAQRVIAALDRLRRIASISDTADTHRAARLNSW